ncbi:MAG TPA: phosphoenolpyruvate synthase [Gemmatimonadota bacterium]|nr:phosphoenolpyruvate synthase [Gemmatimonadota bacterium]
MSDADYIRWFEDATADDIDEVGGKNASLGEMIGTLADCGIRVPRGFAVTTSGYRRFVEHAGIDAGIRGHLEGFEGGAEDVSHAGRAIRALFRSATFPDDLRAAIHQAYGELSGHYEREAVDVAVRSSAVAEDLPDASFAGQLDTFLNIHGEEALLDACRDCYASLFTDRAIAYRAKRDIDQLDAALSIGVQKMVRSDKAGSGVMFTLDTESGFPDVILINAAWGIGELVVQGSVIPDQYMVFKPLLERNQCMPIIEKTRGEKARKMVYATRVEAPVAVVETSVAEQRAYVLDDDEILQLARWACAIERHYGRPMDVEWAKDGETGRLFIVQARPETVHSRDEGHLQVYRLKEPGEPILSGISVGNAIATGRVVRLTSPEESDRVGDGDILVTEMTDPAWGPIMERVSGIITDQGGRTCHAAIVSRELGIPAVVGTGRATRALEPGSEVTLSCAEGDDGHVYAGRLDFEVNEVDVTNMPETRTRIMLNIASPGAAFRWWRLPCEGIGLARMEFIINNHIRIHPMALARFHLLEDGEAREEILRLTAGYGDRPGYFVERLARGIAKIAASQYPDPVIVRMSDFKTNEYADLVGGRQFEPPESNPMLGFRGAARYYSEDYREGFAMECRAIRMVRDEIGLDNVLIMIPFCRTLEEADRVLEVLAENGLERGRDGLEVYVMCEVPSNVILARQFAERFDGFSIGSNDLTQLVLGVDRDSARLSELFDERNEAVQIMIAQVIEAAHAAGRKVGICGQGPSDYPDFAEFLVECGIDSMSLNPDSVVGVKRRVAEVEARLAASAADVAEPMPLVGDTGPAADDDAAA